MRDDERLGVAQFRQDSTLLRNTADKNSSCYTILSRDELNSNYPYASL